MAQRGYRRINPDPEKSKLVSSHFESKGQMYFPAVAIPGEGLFFDIVDHTGKIHSTVDGGKWSELQLHKVDDRFAANTELGGDIYYPTTVWWHSLSHRLINALSIDSGYSSAALRERIYVKGDSIDNSGILIYTSQPGGDGTLGGLQDGVNRIDQILKKALDDINYCSNDPLCTSQRVEEGRVNGAACYACLFVSETSCELKNQSLDRHLLKGLSK